jgi:hypothetical protein
MSESWSSLAELQQSELQQFHSRLSAADGSVQHLYKPIYKKIVHRFWSISRTNATLVGMRCMKIDKQILSVLMI